jgi:hypothetical protein
VAVRQAAVNLAVSRPYRGSAPPAVPGGSSENRKLLARPIPDYRSDEVVVVAVGSNPEPDDGLAVNPAESAVAEADSHGVDAVLLIDLLEVQPRVGRVLPERLASSPGLQPHLIREIAIRLAKASRRERLHPISSSSGRVSPRRCSSRASRAMDRNSAGLSWKLRAHASSSSRVSMIWDAMASCSSCERDSTRRSALSSRPVMLVQ